MPDWDIIIAILSDFGIRDGLFVIFFIVFHYWIWKLYINRLSDRQNEINRIAEENREYRETFMALVNNKLEINNNNQNEGGE